MRIPAKLASLCALALCLLNPRLEAQAARAFSIYLDCQDIYCDPDFYRTELNFVDHVRERTAADVHVLVTAQGTGGGGLRLTLAFYGQNRFTGISDTLTTNTPQGATEEEQRRVIARTVRLGLVRYLARTPEGERVAVSLSEPKSVLDLVPVTRHDPWNAWVFRIGANMQGNSEQSFNSAYINGNVRASRVTELWKTTLSVNENYNEQKFDVDGEKVTSVVRDFSGGAVQVRSINDHWSLGGTANARSSTYLNQRLAAAVAPAVEYDLYPYKESTRRQLIAQYSAGVRYFAYNDTTVYFKTKETRPYESLILALSQRQTWGSIDFSANGYHFLDDLSKSRLSFNLNVDVRILKGLSLSGFANYDVLHDQIYLAKGDLTKDEVLLRQSQLQTGYSAFFYLSLNYTFGSVLNNVVNPRFNNGTGF